ncbi:eukaryotic translation initiation factor 6 [Datura stramonium]|uniref:Eukaryotic translation initiation factor 6 n=1 Tax=Datura stramonium TaxID=4076 RepID=A0ABS8VAY4_DATST|nr:eukaryotic translation initiation factor 6 [Datura stramonium]
MGFTDPIVDGSNLTPQIWDLEENSWFLKRSWALLEKMHWRSSVVGKEEETRGERRFMMKDSDGEGVMMVVTFEDELAHVQGFQVIQTSINGSWSFGRLCAGR